MNARGSITRLHLAEDSASRPLAEDNESLLMRQVGDRVRLAREMKGITRRVLSEESGVSPRYLAQLEAGEGNISIALLHRVASALGLGIEWFVGEDDPRNSDTQRFITLFRSADEPTRRRVMGLLDPETDKSERAQRICLVGLRGAGKSSLGNALAKRLGIPFVELNHEVEQMAGIPLAEIMGLYGQEGYRKLEAEALEAVADRHERVVLEVAGGIVAEPVTFQRMLKRFHTVWIKAAPEEHMDRVRAQGDTRPMAGNPEAMVQLRKILISREPLYSQADSCLDTTGKAFDTSLEALLDLVEENRYLVQSG